MEENNYSGYDPYIDLDYNSNLDNTSGSTTNNSGLFSSFFGSGTGSSLITLGGNLGLTALQNRGSQIKGQYSVELQKLLNDQTKTKAQLDAELGRLNAQRDVALGEVRTEQIKVYLGYGLAIVAVVGIVVGIVVWIKD